MNKCITNEECMEKQYKNQLAKINYRWFIGVLIGVIILILSFKFWDKKEPLQTLISVGSGLVSIALGIFAIMYSMTESIKTNTKETKIDVILDKIEEEVENMGNIVKDINANTNMSLTELSNLKRSNDEIIQKISKFNYERFNKEANHDKEQAFNKSSSDLNGQVYVRPKKVQLRKFQKGDICIVDLGTKNPSALGGTRPVVIVQNSLLNKYAPSLSVIPLTVKISSSDNNIIPTHVPFTWGDKENIAVIEQITTISKGDIIDFIDTVDEETLRQIDFALLFQFGISE